MGNPKYYWTFSDEGAIRDLVRFSQHSHARTRDRRALGKWAWVCQQVIGGKRKR